MSHTPISVTVTINGATPEDAAAKFLDALVAAVEPGVNSRLTVLDQSRIRFDVLGTEASFAQAAESRPFERDDNGKLVEVFGDQPVILTFTPGLGRGWSAGVVQLGAGVARIEPASGAVLLGGRPHVETLGVGDTLHVVCIADEPATPETPAVATFVVSPYA